MYVRGPDPAERGEDNQAGEGAQGPSLEDRRCL